MNIKRWLLLSTGIKGAVVFFFLFLAFGQRMFAQVPIWFDPKMSYNQVRARLKGMADPSAHIDKRDPGGVTGLMFAASEWKLELSKLMLEYGAKVNLKAKKDGNTALHLVVYNGDQPGMLKMMHLLLTHGANPRALNLHRNTPMHFISDIDDFNLRIKLIEMLVKYGADINARDKYGNTILHNAAKTANSVWIKLLYKKFGTLLKTNVKNKAGLTPLQVAHKLKYQLAEKELAKTPKIISGVGKYDDFGLSTLHLAIIGGNKKKVEELVKGGAKVNEAVKDKDKNTPLNLACFHQRVDILSFLLKNKGDPNKTNALGNASLNATLRITNSEKSAQAAWLLMKNGGNVNKKNEAGNTPIHAAVRLNAVNFVAVIVNSFVSKIKLGVKDAKERTALQLARELGRKEIVALLESLGAARAGLAGDVLKEIQDIEKVGTYSY